MKLTSLLKRITELPWTFSVHADPQQGHIMGSERLVADLHACAAMSAEQAKANLAYITHAANVLPELVAAAKHLQRNWEKNLTAPMARLNEAIAKAENVSERKPIKRSDHQAFTVEMAHTSHLCSAHLTYGDCCRIAQAIGLSLGEYEGRDNDGRGLAFTICGGKLNNGHEAEPWIARMNGWPVEDIADEALRRKAVRKVGRWAWQWIEPNTTEKRT